MVKFARFGLEKGRILFGFTVSVFPFSAFAIANHRCYLEEKSDSPVYDVAIVGGGLAGLATARELSIRGNSVLLLEKEENLASGASSGNSGLGHTGYDAPVGSLERRLLRRSIQLHRSIYRSFGLSLDHVKKTGSLVVAWSPEDLEKLPRILEENISAGDVDAELLTQDELRKLEPNISQDALGAVLCPYEAIVEPWLVPMGYAESARNHGAHIWTGSELVNASLSSNETYWKLDVCKKSAHKSAGSESRVSVLAKVVINCAGLNGDDVEQFRRLEHKEEDKEFTITPRKGQFVVFKPSQDMAQTKLNYVIEPTPSQFTKGVIVWTTVYGNIIVGPTATNQESKTDRSTDEKTLSQLRSWGERVVPALKAAEVLGSYSGLRPSCEHRDYQIKAFPSQNWITVGAIRSTGLSAASGIGDYVASLYEAIKRGEPVSGLAYESDLLGVSDAVESPIPLQFEVKPLPTVPTLRALASDFQTHNDGCVEIYGKRMKVTHPISYFGMSSFR